MTSLEPTVADRREAMAVLSKAVVTRDFVPGLVRAIQLPGRQYLATGVDRQGTVFQTVFPPVGTRDFVPGYDRFA